jgi:hypothetical protein
MMKPAGATSDLNFRVVYWDFTNHHDLIGRVSTKKGRRAHRVKPPPKQTFDFYTREAAVEFIADLRRRAGEDEIVAQIVALHAPPRPPPPQAKMLPGDWPLHSRDQ